jgi:uncharacterized protein YjiK
MLAAITSVQKNLHHLAKSDADGVFTLTIPLDILQDPQDIIYLKNLRYV